MRMAINRVRQTMADLVLIKIWSDENPTAPDP